VASQGQPARPLLKGLQASLGPFKLLLLVLLLLLLLVLLVVLVVLVVVRGLVLLLLQVQEQGQGQGQGASSQWCKGERGKGWQVLAGQNWPPRKWERAWRRDLGLEAEAPADKAAEGKQAQALPGAPLTGPAPSALQSDPIRPSR